MSDPERGTATFWTLDCDLGTDVRLAGPGRAEHRADEPRRYEVEWAAGGGVDGVLHFRGSLAQWEHFCAQWAAVLTLIRRDDEEGAA